MCLAKPMRVVRIEDETAWVDDSGLERPVALLGVEAVAAGDYLLVHADLALARLAPHEANEILAALEEAVALGNRVGVTG
jgi:hydrogenase expression/formation protein HypC